MQALPMPLKNNIKYGETGLNNKEDDTCVCAINVRQMNANTFVS